MTLETHDLPPAIRPWWRFIGAMMPVMAPTVYAFAAYLRGRLTVDAAMEAALVGSFAALWGLFVRNPFAKKPQPPTDATGAAIAFGLILGTLGALVIGR